MTRQTRNGFTLAELMVVITIIALLAAIILPFFQRVVAVQRKVACANNLEKLGQAYSGHCAQRRMNHRPGTGLGTDTWQRDLLAQVSQSVEVFHCNADANGGMGKKASLANYYLDVYRGSNYDGSVCLDEDEGEWVWKLSGTQYEYFAGLVAQRGRGNHGYNHAGYVPDSNPNLYYFLFEDMKWAGGADRDFWDLNFMMETTGMDIQVTILHGATGYQHHLFLGAPGDTDRQELFHNCKEHVGETITVKGKSASSYGMNSVADTIYPGLSQKIIIMDYELLLVAGSPYDETSGDRPEQLAERWEPDPKDPSAPLRFARHMGRCNVLFGDGHVKLMYTDDIHPADPEICEKYWDP